MIFLQLNFVQGGPKKGIDFMLNLYNINWCTEVETVRTVVQTIVRYIFNFVKQPTIVAVFKTLFKLC